MVSKIWARCLTCTKTKIQHQCGWCSADAKVKMDMLQPFGHKRWGAKLLREWTLEALAKVILRNQALFFLGGGGGVIQGSQDASPDLPQAIILISTLAVHSRHRLPAGPSQRHMCQARTSTITPVLHEEGGGGGSSGGGVCGRGSIASVPSWSP